MRVFRLEAGLSGFYPHNSVEVITAHTCVICGKEFQTTKRGKAVLCSESCRRKRKVNQARKWHSENKGKVC